MRKVKFESTIVCSLCEWPIHKGRPGDICRWCQIRLGLPDPRQLTIDDQIAKAP